MASRSYVTAKNRIGSDKNLLFSGQFTSLISTSSILNGVINTSFDGTNTPTNEDGTLVLISGQFSSTVKSSFTPGVTLQGISGDLTNTPWVGFDLPGLSATASVLYLQSGKITSTTKTSTRPGGIFAIDISDDGTNTPWADGEFGPSKLFLQSGQFTSVIKDSEDVSAIEVAVRGISFNGVDTPWSGETDNGKFYLTSAQFTSTIKTSQSLGFSVGETIGGIDPTFVTTAVSLSGTIGDSTVEANIVAGGRTIILTLQSARLLPNVDTWDSTVGSNSAATTALLAGLVSSGSELNGWNNEVLPLLNFTHVVRTSDSIVTITLPVAAAYDVAFVEVITSTVPAAALTTGINAIVGDPAFPISPNPVTADNNTVWLGNNSSGATFFLTSGQFTSTIKTSLLKDPGTFQDGFNDLTAAQNTGHFSNSNDILRLSSGQFTNTIKNSQNFSSIDTGMVACGYDGNDTPLGDNSTPEKLWLMSGQFTLTIKTSVDVSAIDNDPQGMAWDGTNTPWTGDQANKLYLQSGHVLSTLKTSQSVSAFDSAPFSISFSATTGDTPWMGAATGKLFLTSGQFSSTLHDSENIVPVSNFGGWGLDVGDRLGGGAGPLAVALSGSVVGDIDEQDIRDGGQSILLVVTGDTWVATAGADNSITQAIIDGIDSDKSEPNGWDAIVKAGLNAANVTRLNDTTISIVLPAFSTYDISEDETITATVPTVALTGGVGAVATPTFDISFIPIPAIAPHRIIDASQLKEYVTYISPDGIRYPLNTPHELGRWVISYSGLGTPPIDYITQRGPFQDGVTVKDFFLNPRLIHLVIRQEFCDRLDWWDGRAALLNQIRPNRQLTPNGVTPGVLEFCLPDSTRRQINLFITEGPRFEPRELGIWDEIAFQEVLRFIAHDPLFFDPTQVVASFVLGLSSNLVFPITFPIQFGSGSISSTLNLSYSGTWNTFPTIVIVGPIENPIITNTTTNEKLQFVIDIAAGRTVTIDLAYGVKTVVDDLGNNLIGNLSADSNLATWHLAPDPEATNGLNVITLTGLNPTGATSVQLQYFTRFYGF